MRHAGHRFALNKRMFRPASLDGPAFVVARDSVPYYSYDGTTWLEGTGSLPSEMYSGAYGNGKYVFAGLANGYMISSNGIDFTYIDSTWDNCGDEKRDRLVYYEPIEKFVAVRGSFGSCNVFTSSDAITWINTVSVSEAFACSDLLITSTGLVFSSYTSSGATPHLCKVFHSIDAVTWNQVYSTVSNATDAGMVIGYSLGNEVGFFSENKNQSIRSTDGGLTWSTQTVTSAGNFTNGGVQYSPDLNLLVGVRNSSSRYMYSVDGITWTDGTKPHFIVNTPVKIGWSASIQKFLEVASGATGTGISSNGTSWTVSTTDPFGFNPSAIIAR